jgi:hypothetical protein
MRLALQEKKTLVDSSRLHVVEIARVPDMLPSLFPSWLGLRTYQHLGKELLFVCWLYLARCCGVLDIPGPSVSPFRLKMISMEW